MRRTACLKLKLYYRMIRQGPAEEHKHIKHIVVGTKHVWPWRLVCLLLFFLLFLFSQPPATGMSSLQSLTLCGRTCFGGGPLRSERTGDQQPVFVPLFLGENALSKDLWNWCFTNYLFIKDYIFFTHSILEEHTKKRNNGIFVVYSFFGFEI